jgi:hypothetical protein
LVLGWTTGKFELTRLTMTWTWGKPPPSPHTILCASPWGPHPNGILSWDSQVGVSKFLNLGLSQLWGPKTLCADLRLKWGLKQNCSFSWELSNSMFHVTCTYKNQGDSRLLVVESQIVNVTPNLSFGHNLCFRCPNGSCEPILDIYVPRDFQWYKERLNSMNFNPCNHPLKVWKSIGTPTPKMGVHLEVWGFIPSHSFAFPGAWNVTPRLTLGMHPRKPLLWSRA